MIYPKDHQPPHVHVLGPGAEAKFSLEDLKCFYSRGFSDKAIVGIESFLKTKKELLRDALREYKQ